MIDRVHVERLSIPLTNPYELSFSTIESFDTVLVKFVDDAGREGIGEATTLGDYFVTGPETLFDECVDVAGEVVGRPSEEARVCDHGSVSTLARSAVGAAVESLADGTVPPVDVPVVGVVSANDDADECVSTAREQVRRGHDVVKVKVGFDPVTDAERLSRLASALPSRVEYRADANRQYSPDEARRFLERVDVDELQHLEQPLPVGSLSAHARLRADSDVPIMLDEEIRGLDSLDAIVEAGAADRVKFKLAKQGAPRTVRELHARATRRGLDVVLGNGVQSDVGCLSEASLSRDLELAATAECNGWLKQSASTLATPLSFEDGRLVWEGGRPILNEDRIGRYRVKRRVVDA